VHINGVFQDPIPWLQEHGVDLVNQTEEIYGQ
jgi:hypothetical protein